MIDMTVGALAAEAATSQALKIDGSRLQGCNPRNIEFNIEYRAKTTLEGPLVYGVSELTTGEISEWWKADPQHDGDDAAFEQSGRHIKLLGYVPFISQGNPLTSIEGMTDIRTATWPGWDLIEGEFLAFFLLNIGLSALSTGMLVDGFMNIRGDWNDK